MRSPTIAERRELHRTLVERIAGLSDGEISALLDAGVSSAGWGRNQTIEIDGRTVFVKRVPLTDLEMEHAYSTRNLFGLPLFYQYGVGSAGFGVFREVAMHVKTTKWVLAGDVAGFPLMYYHRILPRTSTLTPMADDRLDGYVKYWGGSESVRRYWRDREQARHEVVILLEHIPHTLQGWSMDHQAQVPMMVDQLRETIDFLRTQGVIHFDAHFNNVVTDGERVYLTDFGLALDRVFELSEEERAFFERHTQYDYAEVLWSTGYLVTAAYQALPEDAKRDVGSRLGIMQGPFVDPFMPLLEKVEALVDDPALGLHPELVATVVRYRKIITLMQEFFTALRANLRKDTSCPHEELTRLLSDTGFAD